MSLEKRFPIPFAARLALREKQIQQSYRPIIGIHKWFARRPGTLFRNLLLSEFSDAPSLEEGYFRSHHIKGVIADPFAGGGTPVFEANRLGLSVIAADINPMAYWIVRQGLARLDIDAFKSSAADVARDIERKVGAGYRTSCTSCGDDAAVKYFLWVKSKKCPFCGHLNDLFPGYLLAENVRHPRYVVACRDCGWLNEYDTLPRITAPSRCHSCAGLVHVEGSARRNRVQCQSCAEEFAYPGAELAAPLAHRMWAIEYYCSECKPSHAGRFFKRPDDRDLAAYETAAARLAAERTELPIPEDAIPDGDETKRLHRWGYRRFAELFNDRQLLGLGLLLRRILRVESEEVRHSLLTVFSDSLRYQNMVCRYDTYALKCQDIFSVHGFPIGLVQCENSLLGLPGIGSGSFRHFVEKYIRAKEYCLRPFEVIHEGHRKSTKYIDGESIGATRTSGFPRTSGREALVVASGITSVALPRNSLDGVFTDPPYFDAVQYSELMDFCYAWLRQALAADVEAFRREASRHHDDLTGNDTAGRDLVHFGAGLSDIFQHCAKALKPGAPFVFTYHHNDPIAYTPVVMAILDAGLVCTAVLPAPAEMGASLHIAGTSSSVVDSVFVCRRGSAEVDERDVAEALAADANALREGGVRVTPGDLKCLASGHIARIAINRARRGWTGSDLPAVRLARAEHHLRQVASEQGGAATLAGSSGSGRPLAAE